MREGFAVTANGPLPYPDGMLLGSRAVGAAVEDLVSFLRPSVVHVREERERLALERHEEGDAARRLGDDADGVSLRIDASWQAPRGPRRQQLSYDSRGIAV